MNKIVLSAILVALFSFEVQADPVGLYVGGYVWQSDSTGTLGQNNAQIATNLAKTTQFNYFLAVEHPYPLLPNIRISHTSVDSKGSVTLTKNFNFGTESFASNSQINPHFNVSYYDYTLYYELLNRDQASFELGLTVRDFHGDVTVAGTSRNSNGSCNDPEPSPDSPCTNQGGATQPSSSIKTGRFEPMLYVSARLSLPVTRLSAFVQGNYLLKSSDSIYDYQVGLNYALLNSRMLDLDLSLGYQMVQINFDDLNNLSTDLKFTGAFVGAVAHF